jgi:hypothetical protein
VPEHVQYTGIQGFDDGFVPFVLNENAPQPEPPHKEVWGVPWKAAIPFKGLAYTVGGRSVFWGGWSPRLLDDEIPTTWPAETVADLKARYVGEGTRQIGVDETNDSSSATSRTRCASASSTISPPSTAPSRSARCRRRRC